jgi:hypothetical protein
MDISSLDTNGYIILKAVLSPDEGIVHIKDKEVNYAGIKTFIEQSMLGPVNKQLGWDAVYTKYRVSDNNNSVDAGAFHRDIFAQGKTEKFMSFTCLTYLDGTKMELIPGSHMMPYMTYMEAINNYGHKVTVEMKPGDVLLFYSTLLHRGIFTEGLSHRRLIQVFEVFPSMGDFKSSSGRVIHVEGDERYADIMIRLSKNPLTAGIMNMLGYLNASTGYGKLRDTKLNEYLSSEGSSSRLIVIPYKWQAINKYIMNMETRVLGGGQHSEFKYECFNRQFIGYILMFALLLALCYILWV